MALTQLDLPDKVLISGAAGGIGGALAGALARAGCAVTGSDRHQAPASWPGTAWIEADIAVPAGRAALAAAAETGLGGIAFAAGILDPADWEHIDEAAAERLLSVNLLAPFFLTRSLLPRLAPGASIVVIGSVAGLRGSPATPLYSASKAALRNLAASMALLLEPRGIRVNVVAPGLIDTPLTAGLNAQLAEGRGIGVADVEAERAAAIPMGRPGTPEEVADACLFLLSYQSAYTTGSTLFVTGGVLAGTT